MKYLFLEMIFDDQVMYSKYSRNTILVSRLYSRYLNDIKITDLRKITIEIVNDPVENHVIPIHKLIKVCLIRKYFDLSLLETINDPKKLNRIILDFIFQCVMELTKKFDWPSEQFKIAYNKVIESDFKNEFILIPKKLSKDKRQSASIIINCLPEYNSIILELTGTIFKDIELLRVVHYKDDFSNIVHKLKWQTSNELIIFDKYEEICFKYLIESDNLEMCLIPKINDLEYLQDELELMSPNTTIEQYKKIVDKRLFKLY